MTARRTSTPIGDDLREAQPALTQTDGVDGASGRVPDVGDLLVASTADDGWEVRVEGVPLGRTETYGWANQFGATRSGAATLSFATPVSHRAIVVGEVVAWILALWAWRRSRRRVREADRAGPPIPDVAAPPVPPTEPPADIDGAAWDELEEVDR